MCISAAVLTATSAAVSAATGLASIGTSIAASQQQANAARKRGEYEEKIANYNARAAKNAGDVEAIKLGIRQRREFGRRRARAAALGVDLSFGSVARNLEETRRFHAFDSVLLARNVQARVLGARMAGEGAKYNAKVIENEAKLGGIAGAISGTASLASAVNSFAQSGVLGQTKTPEPDSPSARRVTNYLGVEQYDFDVPGPWMLPA